MARSTSSRSTARRSGAVARQLKERFRAATAPVPRRSDNRHNRSKSSFPASSSAIRLSNCDDMQRILANPDSPCNRLPAHAESPRIQTTMDTASPLVTVILPTFDRRKFLPAAIRSIRDQALAEWRLLVVNDGGEDVSDVVSAVADPRIELHDRPHLGKAAALNYGLGLVRSKYVAYMDDDDLVYPDHLAELVAIAEREGAEFVHSDTLAIWTDADGKEVRRQIENAEDLSFDDIRLFNRINHKQILHTKRLADEAGPYDERLRILIDYDYIRRLARLSPPVHLRKVTGEHFLRQAQGSGRAEEFSSITGLWISDPEACGRSVAAVFEKDPAALADLYRYALRDRSRIRTLEETLERTREALRGQTERLAVVENSLSCRIGRAVTAPLRWIVERMRNHAPRG